MQNEFEFIFNNSFYEFTAPHTGMYKLECWGAQGGGNGGKGGYSYGEYFLTKGINIYIYVGGRSDYKNIAGYNGGGTGSTDYLGGYSGGGATDIRLSRSLNDRILVAGGGGGGSNSGKRGGDGGGFNGLPGEQGKWSNVGYGGTLNAGGNGYLKGDFGQGGNAGGAPNWYRNCAGGGGGWYGGGGSTADINAGDGSGAGGGSGYASNKIINQKIIAGNLNMPNPDNPNISITGNSGNGRAKISLLYKSYTHYVLYINNKYYIPSNAFIQNDSLIESNIDYIIDYNNKDMFVENIFSLIRFYNDNKNIINEKFKIIKVINKFIDDGIKYNNDNNKKNNITFNYDPIKEYLLNGELVLNIQRYKDKQYNIINKIGTKNIKVGISNNKYIYGKNLDKINKNEILDKGIDIQDLKDYIIPFDEYKIIICFTNGIEELKEIKQVGLDLYKYKKISDDYLNITTDYKDIYISPTKNINKILVNKLSNDKLEYSKLEKVY